MKYLSPKLDIIFKRIFTDVNNSDLLADFLSCVLDIDYDQIKDIEIENSELVPDYGGLKNSILDLRVVAAGRKINIEIQVNKFMEFQNRALFYWSKLYSKDLKQGDKYSSLMPTYSINILDFNLFDCDEYHSTFYLKEAERDEILTDHIRFDFLELRKAGNTREVTRLMKWIKFLNLHSEEDVEMLKEMKDEKIDKAVIILKNLSADEKLRNQALAREMAEHDAASLKAEAWEQGMAQGRAEGMAQGMAEGRAEGMAQGIKMMVANMKKQGFTDEQIEAITKL